MKNKELKQKAYQLLIDKIDVAVFENFLYQMVVEEDLKTDSLLFDFVNINYKDENYKSLVFSLVNECFSVDELLCFNIYTLCLYINDSKQESEVLGFINDLSCLFIDTEHKYNLLYDFFMFNEEIEWLDFSKASKEKTVKMSRVYSGAIISKLNFYKENEDWVGFLNSTIEKE